VPRGGAYPDTGNNQRGSAWSTFVAFEVEDGSPFVGLLRVEAADARATPNVGPSLA